MAIACWSEYADDDLNLTPWANGLTWLLPEVHPKVMRIADAEQSSIVSALGHFQATTPGWRRDIMRSMRRYRLSQNRQDITDQILDLALAFEIAVSDESGNGPASWKVSVRTAQFLGGSVEARLKARETVNELYKLRNKATHGSSLKSASVNTLLSECAQLYSSLAAGLLSHKDMPDWRRIEMEPPPSGHAE